MIERYMKKYSCLLFLFLISFTIWNLQVEAQEVSVSEPMVVDVTTRSFSVAWTADKASTPQLEVFSGQDGLNSISVLIINVSENYPPAEDQGVLKVAVTGLTAGTTYYFRTTTTAKDGSGSSVYPAVTPLPSGSL